MCFNWSVTPSLVVVFVGLNIPGKSSRWKGANCFWFDNWFPKLWWPTGGMGLDVSKKVQVMVRLLSAAAYGTVEQVIIFNRSHDIFFKYKIYKSSNLNRRTEFNCIVYLLLVSKHFDVHSSLVKIAFILKSSKNSFPANVLQNKQKIG